MSASTTTAACAAETADGVRIGITGAGPQGVRATSAEEALARGDSTADAAQKALEDAELRDDALASAWYRQRLLPVIVQRALDDLGGGR